MVSWVAVQVCSIRWPSPHTVQRRHEAVALRTSEYVPLRHLRQTVLVLLPQAVLAPQPAGHRSHSTHWPVSSDRKKPSSHAHTTSCVALQAVTMRAFLRHVLPVRHASWWLALGEKVTPLTHGQQPGGAATASGLRVVVLSLGDDDDEVAAGLESSLAKFSSSLSSGSES